MDDDKDVGWYHLHWSVFHPHVTWMNPKSFENVETSFLINDTDLSRFDFKLSRQLFNPDRCVLYCTIYYRASYGNLSCHADLKYLVLWNGVEITNSKRRHYFHEKSNFTFAILIETQHTIQSLIPNILLQINVDIKPKGLRKHFNYDNIDMHYSLHHLSDDMAKLFVSAHEATMKIASANSEGKEYAVHPFILQFRWPHFFERHQLRVGNLSNVRLEFPISPKVLRSILFFMYSGKLPKSLLFQEYTFENAELAQVINNFHLYNLYKFLVPQSRHIFQYSLSNTEEWQYEIPFHYVSGASDNMKVIIPIKRLSERVPHELVFCISVIDYGTIGRWLSYDLLLKSDSTAVFEVQIFARGHVMDFLHSRIFNASRHCSRSSGPVVFLGSQKTFSRTVFRSRFRLMFKILYSDGKTKTLTHDETASNRYESLAYANSLSDLSFDMEEVYKTGLHYNCELIPMYRDRTNYNEHFMVHKAIIWTRMPSLRYFVNNFDIFEVQASVESMNCIFHYMYTGRFTSKPDETVALDIFKFAFLYQFRPMLNHIRDLLPKVLGPNTKYATL
ncbi:hypothetical protein NPIL_577951 [Nephila pilipes]|uniref:BTB domain-containing protein n=1 Tax=Nephila pilipes TaxID=299642 RepID=A0A8X6TWF7_NEPPI|nr:hypothetical protein NPIL_577951 [Nephila pilipes]